jgi:hypothetical protein
MSVTAEDKSLHATMPVREASVSSALASTLPGAERHQMVARERSSAAKMRTLSGVSVEVTGR